MVLASSILFQPPGEQHFSTLLYVDEYLDIETIEHLHNGHLCIKIWRTQITSMRKIIWKDHLQVNLLYIMQRYSFIPQFLSTCCAGLDSDPTVAPTWSRRPPWADNQSEAARDKTQRKDQSKCVKLTLQAKKFAFPPITWFPRQASPTPESPSQHLWEEGICELCSAIAAAEQEPYTDPR